MTLLSGCTSQATAGKQAWLDATAQLLSQPVENLEDDYFTQLYLQPPSQEHDVYSLAAAVTAMGPSTRTSRQKDVLVAYLSDLEGGARTTAPAAYVLEMIVRADRVSPFLGDVGKRALKRALAAANKLMPATDPIDYMMGARVAEAVGGAPPVDALTDCQSSDAFVVLASRATYAHEGADPSTCDSGDRAWDRERDRLELVTATGQQILTPLDCDTLLILAETADTGQRKQLEDLHGKVNDMLRDERVLSDPTSCLAAIQLQSIMLDAPSPVLTTAQRVLMEWQLEGGGAAGGDPLDSATG